jgi:hypothetical protein
VPSDNAAADLAVFMDRMVEGESTVHAISMNIAQGDLSAESWGELQDRLS